LHEEFDFKKGIPIEHASSWRLGSNGEVTAPLGRYFVFLTVYGPRGSATGNTVDFLNFEVYGPRTIIIKAVTVDKISKQVSLRKDAFFNVNSLGVGKSHVSINICATSAAGTCIINNLPLTPRIIVSVLTPKGFITRPFYNLKTTTSLTIFADFHIPEGNVIINAKDSILGHV